MTSFQKLYLDFFRVKYPGLSDFYWDINQTFSCLPDHYGDICYGSVYSVHSFGHFFNYLLLPEYEEDMPYILNSLANGSVYAYVYNMHYPELSECGFISVCQIGDDLVRLS